MFITPYFSPAFTTTSLIKGTCTAEQKALFPASSTTLIPDNPKLLMHALYGNQSGIVQIDSTYTMNLVQFMFSSLTFQYKSLLIYFFFLDRTWKPFYPYIPKQKIEGLTKKTCILWSNYLMSFFSYQISTVFFNFSS